MDFEKSLGHQDNINSIFSLIELVGTVESWSYLGLEGALGHFLMHDDVHEVKAQNDSTAELFRAFLRVQGVKEWNYKDIWKLQRTVYNAAASFRRIKKESSCLTTTMVQQTSRSSPPPVGLPSIKQEFPTNESASSKQPRMSSFETTEEEHMVVTEDAQQDEPLEENIYDASPQRNSRPSGKGIGGSSSTIDGAATDLTKSLNNTHAESACEASKVQSQAGGNPVRVDQIDERGSEGKEFYEDLFQSQLTQATEDLIAARKEFKRAGQLLAATTKAIMSATKDFAEAWSYTEIEPRCKKMHILCLKLSSTLNSTDIQAAATACREIGLAAESEILELLEPAIANEKAREEHEKWSSRLKELQSKLAQVLEEN